MPSPPSTHRVQQLPRLIRIGGVVPYSSSDYPGLLAAVIFIQGCPWRCGYCHNPHLQTRHANPHYHWPQLIQFLQRRLGLLDAVVFSGGEPTIDPHLASAIQQVKGMGFKVGLHTAGIYPKRLEALLPLLDWVGLDIKTDFSAYDALTGVNNSHHGPRQCLKLLQNSQINYECRTTIHPLLHSPEQIFEAALQLKQYGVQEFALQVFRRDGCQNTMLNDSGQYVSHYPDTELCKQIQQFFKRFTLRNA